MESKPRLAEVTYSSLLVTYLGAQWGKTLMMSILLLAGIALQLVNPQILRFFIDTALAGGELSALFNAGLLFVGLALIIQIVTVSATYFSENVAWTATNRLRSDLVAHCLRLDMSFHKTHTAGEMIERIDGDVNTLSNFFSRSVIFLIGNTLLVIGIIVLLFREDWRVGVVMGIFVLLTIFILLRLRSFAIPFWKEMRERTAETFGFLGEYIAGTADLRANGATNYVMQRFYGLLQRWLPSHIKSHLSGVTMWTTTLLLFGLGNALAFAVGAYLWSTGAISIGTVYLVFYYTNLLKQPIEGIRRELTALQQAGAGIVRIRELLQLQPTIVDGSGTDLPNSAMSVTFSEVTFGYNADAPVLQDVSFSLQAGKVLGVLGRTGSGKTTLARLLLRFYDVQQGEILLGGVPIRSVRLHDLHRHIGMVTQDVQLFQASVRDNLTFFDRTISDTQILAVLDDLGLKSWYTSLPEGLDSLLGSDGEGLSAGEAQLLAFARVFLSNPGLVILDEASSRLDPATEQLIEQAISKLLNGRTALMIAHRLATVQRADEILIIQDRRILEHDEHKILADDPTSRFYQLLQTGLEEVLT